MRERARVILPEDHGSIQVPGHVAVCPYCDGALTVHVEAWSEGPDGFWFADEAKADCDTEPDIVSPDWRNWMDRHSEMPYVYMLPVEERIQRWLNRNFVWDLGPATHESAVEDG
jgi:hypothetical protein